MDATKWNRIRYTFYSPFYDLIVRGFDRMRARSIDKLDIKQGQSVLVIGAGTGLDLPYIPKGAKVTATDITPAMVERIRARASALGLDVRAEVMDGQRLDLPDESFDYVILHLIIAVIPEPGACIREAQRVLKPGGRAVIFDKFLADGKSASAPRRLANVVSKVFFTDINRRLGDILNGTEFKVISNEPAAWGGMFRIVLIEKPWRA